MRLILCLLLTFLPCAATAQSIYVTPVEQQLQMERMKQNFNARRQMYQQGETEKTETEKSLNEHFRELAKEGIDQRREQLNQQ